MKRIAIIGGGILGLMSLYQLSRAFGRQVRIEVYAESLFTRQTCSYRKGGFLAPFFSEGDDIPRWTRVNYDLYAHLCGKAPGVMRRTLRVFLEEGENDRPAWLKGLPVTACVRNLDVPLPPGAGGGFQLETFVLDQERFLPWLLSESMTGNVEICLSRVRSLDELAEADVVIDAAGLGVKDFGFPEARPIRGQWLLLDGDLTNSPGGNGVYTAPESPTKPLAYAVGGEGWTLVGGTCQVGDSDQRIRPDNEATFLKAATEMVPQLQGKAVITRGVQFRPSGGSARIVRETRPNGTPIYHLVFPGGSGITLCAGYAGDVVKAVREDLDLSLVSSEHRSF